MTVFESVAYLKLAHLKAGMIVETKGYYTAGDGGQARYLVVTAQAADEYGDHTLANGNVAVLQVDGAVSVKRFGAFPSVSVVIQEAAFNAASTASDESVYVPYDTYDLNSGTFAGKFHSLGTPVFTTGTITVLNLNA